MRYILFGMFVFTLGLCLVETWKGKVDWATYNLMWAVLFYMMWWKGGIK